MVYCDSRHNNNYRMVSIIYLLTLNLWTARVSSAYYVYFIALSLHQLNQNRNGTTSLLPWRSCTLTNAHAAHISQVTVVNTAKTWENCVRSILCLYPEN
jgi:hypothetical protein